MTKDPFTIRPNCLARFDSDLRRSKADLEDATRKFNEAALTNFAYAIEWHAAPTLRAQARYEVALYLLGQEFEEELDPAEVAGWLATAIGRLAHSRDGESGSTSGMTRLKESIYESVRVQYVGMLLD